MGALQVKKPDDAQKKNNRQGLQHPNVLLGSKLYDCFMKQLPNVYGLSPIFGILMDFVSWRIIWLLPDDDAVMDDLAAEPAVAWFEDDNDDLRRNLKLLACNHLQVRVILFAIPPPARQIQSSTRLTMRTTKKKGNKKISWTMTLPGSSMPQKSVTGWTQIMKCLHLCNCVGCICKMNLSKHKPFSRLHHYWTDYQNKILC
jgi:hypothetical protein